MGMTGMLALMIRSVVDDAPAIPRGDRYGSEQVRAARFGSMNADAIAGLDVTRELLFQVRRRVHDNGDAVAGHHESVDLAMGIEEEALDCSAHLGQAVGVDPMHVVLLCLA